MILLLDALTMTGGSTMTYDQSSEDIKINLLRYPTVYAAPGGHCSAYKHKAFTGLGTQVGT
jgi:hypothetical protein